MTDIALVLFDLNGVLYRYDRDARVNALASATNIPPAAITAAIWNSGYEDSGDAGAMNADAYLNGFCAQISGLTEAEWVAALQAAITPIPETLALMPRIRGGVICAVLTNNNLLVRRHFAKLYPEVATRVGDRAFVSAEFGARKPDPGAYRGCLARLGVHPAEALFIDDSQANVAGAHTAGLAAHHTTSPADLAAELERRGLLI